MGKRNERFNFRKEIDNVSENPPRPRGHQEAPVYHIVVADSRFAARRPLHRAARLLQSAAAKDKTERLKLDLEKVKAWMAKGALPTDRVLRFLDEAGVMKRETRNNPEKSQAEEEGAGACRGAAKAAAAASAAAEGSRAGELTAPSRPVRDRDARSASRRSAPRTACAARCG